MFGDFVDLITQVGTHAVDQGDFAANLVDAVTDQRDVLGVPQFRAHQLADDAVAKIPGQHQRPVLAEQRLGGGQSVGGAPTIVLAHQAEGVANDTASLVGLGQGELDTGRVIARLRAFKPREGRNLPSNKGGA